MVRKMEEGNSKGRVCVTGGTGFLGSWMIKRLLEDGYSVNTTTRIDPERKRDISYLENRPGTSEKLQIFNADLDQPDSFAAALEGCVGVFHMAHPLDFEEREPEEVKIKRVINAMERILQKFGGSVTKILAEKAAFDLAQKLGLDIVTVIPTWVTGPFICPHWPDSVYVSMALIHGDKEHFKNIKDTSVVHVDDVARAHIHLFEYPQAKGRYICSAVDVTIEELCEFTSARYPEYKMPSPDSWKDLIPR